METPLTNIKAKFAALPGEVPVMMKEIFQDIKPVVEDMNTDQLDRGERPDGSVLPDYSPNSVLYYGKPAGPMRMYDKGFFWGGITLEVHDDGVELVGHDIKTKMLELHYGKLVGIQERNKEKIEEDYLKPEMEPKMKDFLEK